MEEEQQSTPVPEEPTPGQTPGSGEGKKQRRHWIHPTWLRRLLKTLGWILLVIILIPILVYIPPVQTLLKDETCKIVEKSTGMKISIGKFRLKFPVDVSLKDVCIVEATGDTMVKAREAIADVKLLPLLSLDVKVKKLQLLDGYYRMVSPDSSMVLKLDAGFVEVDSKSSVDIKKSRIMINEAKLKDADVQLFMDVWKQKSTPPDTTSTPFYISANRIDIENMKFGMSMLPTIDTLTVQTDRLQLRNGVIDLANNKIHLNKATLNRGSATYITPTPEYIAAHPAPMDTTKQETPPFTIVGDTLGLCNFRGVYAVKGAQPLPGFDANYIEGSDICLQMVGFYNQATTVRLPFTQMQMRERCGLAVNEGSGLVEVNELGLKLDDLKVKTLFSNLKVTADLPFEAMAMGPDADMAVIAEGAIGLGDVESFMPDLAIYTKAFPQGKQLAVNLDAFGSVSDLTIRGLHLDMPGVLGIDAKGHVKNPMDMKNLVADVDFDGYLANPSVADKLAGGLDMDLPSFDIKGKVRADRQNYLADIAFKSPAGNLVADGRLGLNSETYNVHADVKGLDVKRFMPTLGVGTVTATVDAVGAGFNPSIARAHTDAKVHVAHIDYNGVPYKDISLEASLQEGVFDVMLDSPNKYLDVSLDGHGTIEEGTYIFDVAADLYNVDLQGMKLSETPMGAHGGITLSGSAVPEKWLYDVDLELEDLFLRLDAETEYHFREVATAKLVATEDSVDCRITSDQANLDFDASTGLKNLLDRFTALMPDLTRQVEQKNMDMEVIHTMLPEFNLSLNASGAGILHKFLQPTGIELDTVYLHFRNADKLEGDAGVWGIKNGDLSADTLTLALMQRGSLMDYKIRMANRPGTLDEFALVNLNGYLGQNRVALSLSQRNIKGETGYRLGLTGAFQDSVVYLHFTPLNATIGYMPWKFNTDNHIDLGPGKQINASLIASSKESSILLESYPDSVEGTRLHAKLDNIKIQDFLQMSAMAPPVKGIVNANVNLVFREKGIGGNGMLSVGDLTYEKTKIGNLDFQFRGGTNMADRTGGRISMLVDGRPALTLRGRSLTSTDDNQPMQLSLLLEHFPLHLANAFLEKDVAKLEGALTGHMQMTGSFLKPQLNGSIACDSVAVYLPIIGSKLKFDNDSITVADNVLDFNKFNIWAQNSNPLTVDGTVNFKKLTNLLFNLSLNGNNVQVVNNDKRARSDIYGKLFVNLNATVKGPQNFMDIAANLNILNTTDVTYALPTNPALAAQTSSADGVVKFVNFNDTVQVAQVDTVEAPAFNMRINADLSIASGTQATVILSPNGTDRVELTPSGNLHYSQNYMGDMRLTGQLNIGEGFARYNIPVLGDKKFTFQPNSYVLWRGDLMNPILNIQGTDKTKASVSSGGGNSRMVNFDVGLSITNTLSAPKVLFNLSTKDDISVENELQSMTAEQRSSTAMNLLITGQYTAQGFSGGDFNLNNQVYGFLTSKLNSWMANNVRGVDLSFGIDQENQTIDGRNSTSMSYSYQVSKSLFNNKFKIVVGGNYSTDASADENFSQNLVNDIAFEYMLKQTNNLSLYLKLFRHTGYESILEGEITETGLGVVMKRRLGTLRSLFRIPGRRRNRSVNTGTTDTVATRQRETPAVTETTDTIQDSTKERRENEK